MGRAGQCIQSGLLVLGLCVLLSGCQHWAPYGISPTASGQFRATLSEGRVVYGEKLINTGPESFVLLRSSVDSLALRISDVESVERRGVSAARTTWLGIGLVVGGVLLYGAASGRFVACQ